MKKVLILAIAAMLFTTLAGASAFADQRDPEGTWRDGRYGRDYDRVTVDGRISRVFRDSDGWRVELDRDRRSFWIPDGRLGGRDLREGAFVHVDGFYRNGIVYVDDIGYGGREIRGVVDRVNYRLHYVILREWDGDFIKVDTRPIERRHIEPDTDDLRRGDAIAISGYWSDGLFRAERIDRIRRRW